MSGRKKKKPPIIPFPASSGISQISISPIRKTILGKVGYFCKKGEEEMKGKRKAAVGGFLLVSLKTAAQPFCWEAADGARSRME